MASLRTVVVHGGHVPTGIDEGHGIPVKAVSGACTVQARN